MVVIWEILSHERSRSKELVSIGVNWLLVGVAWIWKEL